MAEAVQRELVTALGGVAGDRVVAQELLADQEERGLDAETVERVEQRGGGVLVGPVVERERRAAPAAVDPLERGQRPPALQGLDLLAEARN
jgi:hypothetical protein